MADLVAALQEGQTEEGFIWLPQFKVDSGLVSNPEVLKQLSSLVDDRPETVYRANIRSLVET